MRMQMNLSNPRYRTDFKGIERYALGNFSLKRVINRRANVVRRAIIAKLPRDSGALQESVYREPVSTRHGRWGWRYAVRIGSDLPYAARIEYGPKGDPQRALKANRAFREVAEAYNAPKHPRKL